MGDLLGNDDLPGPVRVFHPHWTKDMVFRDGLARMVEGGVQAPYDVKGDRLDIRWPDYPADTFLARGQSLVHVTLADTLAFREIQSAPKFEYLVIVAAGRSGSTLLQGVFNSAPGFCIRGENRNLAYHLFKANAALDQCIVENSAGGVVPEHPFFGSHFFDTDRFIADQRLPVIRQLAPPEDTRVLGFKEVRWMPREIGNDLDAYVAFLRKLLPGVRFVLLSRDIDAIARSMMRVHFYGEHCDIEALKGEIADFYRSFRSSIEGFSEIAYEDLVAANDQVLQTLAGLGVTLTREALREVLARAHSYS